MEITGQERSNRTRIHQHCGWLSRLFKALARTGLDNVLPFVDSLTVSVTGSWPDPHTVHLFGPKELHPVWLPSPRDFLLLLLGPLPLDFIESKCPLPTMCAPQHRSAQVLDFPPLVSVFKMYVSFYSAIQFLGISSIDIITHVQKHIGANIFISHYQ